jgi:hypothetical protein
MSFSRLFQPAFTHGECCHTIEMPALCTFPKSNVFLENDAGNLLNMQFFFEKMNIQNEQHDQRMVNLTDTK